MFTKKDIEAAKRIDLSKIPNAEEAKELFKKGEFPEFFYDEKHEMLYKRVTVDRPAILGETRPPNHIYKHII